QSSSSCQQESFNQDNTISGSIGLISTSPSNQGVHATNTSHKANNVMSPMPNSKRCRSPDNAFQSGTGLSSRKKAANDVFKITSEELDLDELLAMDDPVFALTTHCGGPSSNVNHLAGDLLIGAIRAQEAMNSQRENTTPPLLRELQLDDTDVHFRDGSDREEEVEEAPLIPEQEQEVMRTPTPPARKRNCLPKTPKRKRLRDPTRWLDTIRKTAKNAGQSYTSKRGKTVNAVRMKGPCACPKLCIRKVSEQDRLKLFSEYYSTNSQRDKWEFITRHSESTPVVRKTTIGNSRRKNSRKYFFYVGPKGEEKKEYVCKTMFINTLSISHAVIDSAYKHLKGGDTHILSPDKRGRHGNRPKKTTEDQKRYIRQHINLYPRVPSHYCRERSQREYLEWALSLKRMSNQYVEWCKETNVPAAAVASRRQYITVLCSEFNISFFKPKKDQCALCRLIKTSNREEREKFKDKFVKHQSNKKLARKELKEAKEAGINDSSIKVIAFDLQKVLPIPKSEVSVFFFFTKINFLSTTLFDLVRKEGVCHLWHEAVAKRGANEISSCNENDSIHARIESEAKRKELFDMDEWIKLIQSAKQKDPMYEVKIMKREDIFEFHQMVDSYQQWKKDTNGRKIEWSKVKILKYPIHATHFAFVESVDVSTAKVFKGTDNTEMT
ncbi:LOW QUALITY PROTEIN: Glutamine-rich protein 2, partial [Frankliniella fusca]